MAHTHQHHHHGAAPTSHHHNPRDIDVDEVLTFVTSVLPPPPASILEVGCGDGRLALELQKRGWSVKAIDRDPDAVAAAKRHGVDAECADVVAFEGGPFSAVLFTRSLHHVWPLEAAVAKAKALTAPGGLLVLDEFAHDEADAATAAWFQDVQALLEEAGMLTPARHAHDHQHAHQHPGEEPPPSAPLERWNRRFDHDPPLHGGQAMLDAIGAAFNVTQLDRVACLYRAFADQLEPGERGVRLFRRVRALETARVAAGLIVPIGLRVVAHRR